MIAEEAYVLFVWRRQGVVATQKALQGFTAPWTPGPYDVDGALAEPLRCSVSEAPSGATLGFGVAGLIPDVQSRLRSSRARKDRPAWHRPDMARVARSAPWHLTLQRLGDVQGTCRPRRALLENRCAILGVTGGVAGTLSEGCTGWVYAVNNASRIPSPDDRLAERRAPDRLRGVGPSRAELGGRRRSGRPRTARRPSRRCG